MQVIVQVLETVIVVSSLAAINLLIRIFIRRRLVGLEGHQHLIRLLWLIVAIGGAAYLAVVWGIVSLLIGTVATIGALAIVIGLAVMPWLADILVGISLYVSPMIKVGAEIEIDGMRGRIDKINLTTTEILGDGGLMIVPNRKFREEIVRIISTK